jgi:hypothetical protein
MSLPRTTIGGFSVRGIQSFEGGEGVGTNATLLKDGVPVATIHDEGNGGCWSLRPIIPKGKKLEDLPAGWYRTTIDDLTAECGRVAAKELADAGIENHDTLWATLCDNVDHVKSLKRRAKTHVIWTVPGQAEGQLFALKVAPLSPDDAKNRQKILDKHPTATILNDQLKVL